jgi:excisionase family DNA binding protein
LAVNRVDGASLAPVPSGIPDDIDRRLGRAVSELEIIAAELPRERLPDLFGALERARRIAELRFQPVARSVDPEVPDRLLTVAEVAVLLGLERSTIYRWAGGRLRQAVVRVGDGSVRFDQKKLKAFINARRA